MIKTTKTHILDKVGNFTYEKFKYVLGYIKKWHQRILQVTEEDLRAMQVNRNPYQMFLDWSLETLTYGFIQTVILSTLFIGWGGFWRTISLTIALGLLRWFVLELVGDVKDKVTD